MTAAVTAEPETGLGTARPTKASRFSIRWIAIGMLVLQVAWLFAIPPFRGSDEFDHVYRAASVARGQWLVTPAAATRGTGAWLQVPVDIVQAARPQCAALPYTGVQDCVGWWHDGMARIASGAGRYHPLFYALVGYPARPFTGFAALYVMRLMTILLSWGLFCCALIAARRWAKTSWPLIGIAASSTPVLIYSASIVAPNGVEMMAAIALWTAMLGLLTSSRRAPDMALIGVATLAGSILATLRALGPVWCLLIAGSAIALTTPSATRLREMLKSKWLLAGAGLVFVSALQGVIWTLRMHTLNIGDDQVPAASTLGKLAYTSGQVPLWVLQSIAAFPLRDEQSRPVVYGCYLCLFLALWILGFRAGTWRARSGLILITLVSVLLPFCITVINYSSSAGYWQGRYGLPYAVGIVIAATYALDRSQRRLTPPWAIVFLGMFTVSQVVAPLAVLLKEAANSPLRNSTSWLQPSPVVLGTLATIGALALWGGASVPRRAP